MKREEKELVIARLRTIPDTLQLVMGMKSYSGKELIKEIENETDDGIKIVKIHMEYLKSLSNGTLIKEIRGIQ